jgi:prefoldin subunit 5
MASVQDMAVAHLNNVQKAIEDLKTQKANVEQEIEKLQTYYEAGVKELTPEQQKVQGDTLVN